jgi:hypothetical protein
MHLSLSYPAWRSVPRVTEKRGVVILIRYGACR